MEDFLGICLLAYILFGIMFSLEVISKLNKSTVKFVKGDIVLAIVFLPFTLVLLVVLLSLIIATTVEDCIKLTRLENWWKSPIRNKNNGEN